VESILNQEHGDVFIHCDGAKNLYIPENLEVVSYIQELYDSKLVKDFKIHEENLGTLVGISRSIDWFFSHREEGLIVEDDIILVQGGLKIAEIMFDQMKIDESIGAISLRNTVPSNILVEPQELFRYSRLISSHGWGTSRLKWLEFNHSLDSADNCIRDLGLKKYFGIFSSKAFLENIKRDFMLESEKIERANWDIRWSYTNLINGWKIINMNFNLVEYVGYGPNSTHHKNFKANANLVTCTSFPEDIKFPSVDTFDQGADRHRFRHEMHHTLARFLVRRTRRALKR